MDTFRPMINYKSIHRHNEVLQNNILKEILFLDVLLRIKRKAQITEYE